MYNACRQTHYSRGFQKPKLAILMGESVFLHCRNENIEEENCSCLSIIIGPVYWTILRDENHVILRFRATCCTVSNRFEHSKTDLLQRLHVRAYEKYCHDVFSVRQTCTRELFEYTNLPYNRIFKPI